MLEAAVEEHKNVSVTTFGGLLVDFAKRMYLADWTTHPNDLGEFPPLLMTSYASYPVNAQSAKFPGGSLQPYSFMP